MNRYITILLMTAFTIVITSCSMSVEETELVTRNDTLYRVNSDQPYTGSVYVEFEPKKIQKEYSVKNGQLDGKYTEYYSNGQKKVEANYINGLYDGIQKSYYENGQLRRKEEYSDGSKSGEQTSYYELSGNIQDKYFYKNGSKAGEQLEFYESGTIKTKTILNEEPTVEDSVLYYSDKGNLERIITMFDYSYEKQIIFDEGNVIFEKLYSNGDVISLNYYHNDGHVYTFPDFFEGSIFEVTADNWPNPLYFKFEENGKFISSENKSFRYRSSRGNWSVYTDGNSFSELKLKISHTITGGFGTTVYGLNGLGFCSLTSNLLITKSGKKNYNKCQVYFSKI